MYQQGYITPPAVLHGRQQAAARRRPTSSSPASRRSAPYFTSWLRPQILAAMGLGHGVPASVAEYRAYFGGLKIRTTLDLKLQQAAEQAISSELPDRLQDLPSASLVAIDNKTGEVRAMVGGPIINGQEDYDHHPFNLATEGHRQPGSAFKPFTLAIALESGYGPSSVIDLGAGRLHRAQQRRQGALHRPQLRQHVLGHDHARAGDGDLGQLGVRAAGDPGPGQERDQADRAPGQDDGDPLAGVEQLRDDPRRTQGGRHARSTWRTPTRRSPRAGARSSTPSSARPTRARPGSPRSTAPAAGSKTITRQARPTSGSCPPEVAATVQQMLTGVVRFGTATSAADRRAWWSRARPERRRTTATPGSSAGRRR